MFNGANFGGGGMGGADLASMLGGGGGGMGGMGAPSMTEAQMRNMARAMGNPNAANGAPAGGPLEGTDFDKMADDMSDGEEDFSDDDGIAVN
jgi:hypothetical protein